MKKKKFILLAIVLISLLQLTMLVMLASWNTVIKPGQVMYNFLLNLPNWFFIGGVDFLLIYFLEKKVKWKNDILRIVSDLLVCNFVVLLFTVILNHFVFNAKIPPYLIQFAIPIVIWNSMIIFVFEIFIYNRKQIEVEKKLARAEKEKIQYQYETLKAQINPHFLFNSLNVLSSLAYLDADKANKFTKKLSSVYRYLLLTNSRPEVSLREELSFLDSYLYLEKIRFENTFSIDIIIDDDNLLTNKVIPVTLQLLVENILKHNISTREKPLHAQIHITDNGIYVKNSLQLRSSVDKGGIGLLNLQRQYELHDNKISIIQTDSEFIVQVPYIE